MMGPGPRRFKARTSAVGGGRGPDRRDCTRGRSVPRRAGTGNHQQSVVTVPAALYEVSTPVESTVKIWQSVSAVWVPIAVAVSR